MAVPPADDGQVAVVDTSRPSSTLAILSLVLTLVVVACLGVLVVRYVSVTEGSSFGDRAQQLFGAGDAAESDDAAGREAVMNQADQFLLRVNTYGPGDLDDKDAMPEYAQRVRDVITPKFGVDFDKNVTLAEQSVSQAGYARSAELLSTGVDTITDDTATVLVAGVFSSSYPDSRRKTGRLAYPDQPFRVSVTLVKIEGTWLVDNFTPVTDPSDPAEDPGAVVSEPPASPASPATPSSTGGATP